MYLVELWHHHPCYRNGDLEDMTELLLSEYFKTKAKAKSFVLWRALGKPYKTEWNTGNKSSYLRWNTSKTWVNENSGETHQEYFCYEISKVKI